MLVAWGKPAQAAIVAFVLAAQVVLMTCMLRDPRRSAPIYNATGTTLYVMGMLTAACAVPLAFPAVG
jgi:chlorophyll/bacteriochlorophyll a synthase